MVREEVSKRNSFWRVILVETSLQFANDASLVGSLGRCMRASELQVV